MDSDDEAVDGRAAAAASLALLQADLDRTITNAPTMTVEWSGDRGFLSTGSARHDASGGFETPESYEEAVEVLADELQEALEESLLGFRTTWPRCPQHGQKMVLEPEDDGHHWQCPAKGGHSVAALGELGADAV